MIFIEPFKFFTRFYDLKKKLEANNLLALLVLTMATFRNVVIK